jgi:hypothetical protein
MEKDLPEEAKPVARRVESLLKEALAARGLEPEQRATRSAELARRLDELCQEHSGHDNDAVRRLVGAARKTTWL